ncbi:CGNR zinc finger domain-containing protein [Mycobacterium sp. 852002-40037_SCH5390672]|uniref:CGNR zinc finger domain-containing protein n=1 Tax=Mycobacterium sp. 852002-40037_SCH5390672 TaxID=1834089 RepID=UPI000A7D576A|nr:CGNR zinc finger domain-containing protein [Mycobacterium sp. 852002-40037_SCH5390672]
MPSQRFEPHQGLFGVAPDSLVLVQEFLNTAPIQGYDTDLLVDVELAGNWCAATVPKWVALRGADAEPPSLKTEDLPKLRELRDGIAKMLNGISLDSRQLSCISSVHGAFALSDCNGLRITPTGSGWRWLASALFSEIYRSQLNDTWRRIKQCRLQSCGTTFYDRSKNNSGAWCNVKRCGNAANLRALRARRRDERQRAAANSQGTE